MKTYPTWFLPTLWVCFGLLAASGLLLIPGMLMLRLEMEVPEALVPAGRIRWAAMHGFMAFVSVIVVGALLPQHARQGLRQRRSRLTGILLLWAWGVAIVSGWGIYYLADEFWSLWSSLTHVTVVLALMVVLAAHVLAGRRA